MNSREEIKFSHKIDLDRFEDALHLADDIGVLIRCHFEIETVVDHVLQRLTEER